VTITLRNFDCPAIGSRCEDPRCKKSLCALEQEIENRAAEYQAEASRFRTQAKKVLHDWCEAQGKPMPAGNTLERALKHPQVVNEAKRRAAFGAGLVR
jgi:hypothetical protein